MKLRNNLFWKVSAGLVVVASLLIFANLSSGPRVRHVTFSGYRQLNPDSPSITIEFNRDIQNNQDLEVIFTPKIDFDIQLTGKKLYITPSSSLNYDYEYQLSIDNYLDSSGARGQKFTTKLITAQPTGYYLTRNSKSEVEFDQYSAKDTIYKLENLNSEPQKLFEANNIRRFHKFGKHLAVASYDVSARSDVLFVLKASSGQVISKHTLNSQIVTSLVSDSSDNLYFSTKLNPAKEYAQSNYQLKLLTFDDNFERIDDKTSNLYPISIQMAPDDETLLIHDFSGFLYLVDSKNLANQKNLGQYAKVSNFDFKRQRLIVLNNDGYATLNLENQTLQPLSFDRLSILDAKFSNNSDTLLTNILEYQLSTSKYFNKIMEVSGDEMSNLVEVDSGSTALSNLHYSSNDQYVIYEQAPVNSRFDNLETNTRAVQNEIVVYDKSTKKYINFYGQDLILTIEK